MEVAMRLQDDPEWKKAVAETERQALDAAVSSVRLFDQQRQNLWKKKSKSKTQ